MAIDSTPFGEVFLAQDEFDASQVDRLCVELLGVQEARAQHDRDPGRVETHSENV